MVGMMDLSVLCDRCYPTEQGYITGESGVQIEHGLDDRPICSVTDFILLNGATLQLFKLL